MEKLSNVEDKQVITIDISHQINDFYNNGFQEQQKRFKVMMITKLLELYPELIAYQACFQTILILQ